MNCVQNMKNIYYKLFFSLYQKENPKSFRSSPWSRLVAVDTLVLRCPTPPQHVDVFGSQPRVSAQRGLSQTPRQQPANSHTFTQTHFSVIKTLR